MQLLWDITNFISVCVCDSVYKARVTPDARECITKAGTSGPFY